MAADASPRTAKNANPQGYELEEWRWLHCQQYSLPVATSAGNWSALMAYPVTTSLSLYLLPTSSSGVGWVLSYGHVDLKQDSTLRRTFHSATYYCLFESLRIYFQQCPEGFLEFRSSNRCGCGRQPTRNLSQCQVHFSSPRIWLSTCGWGVWKWRIIHKASFVVSTCKSTHCRLQCA